LAKSPHGEAIVLRKSGETIMNLPKIDLSALPDLDQITGVFGSLMDTARIQSSDDSLIIMMTFIYQLTHP